MTLATNDVLARATRRISAAIDALFGKASSLFVTRARQPFGFEASDGAVSVVVDGDGRLVRPPAALASFFRGAGEGARGALVDFFLPEEKARLQTAFRISAQTRLTARARRPDGAVGVFDLHLDAPRPDDVADGRFGAARAVLIVDRTEETAAAARLARGADAARAEARASAAALADLSHEMKTPLNAVIGFAETIREETFGPVGHPRYNEYAEHIRASGEHLLDLVVALLDIARIDADRLSLSPVLTDAARLAEECAAMVRGSAETAGLRLVLDIDPDLPECVLDPRAVRQILLNLLTNAVKFTSDGEVRLSLRREKAAMSESGRDVVVFTVADTGIGMSAEDLARLGPRFTDAHGAGVRGADGAGLGLSLAFRLAEMHGGSLDLDSSPGEGVRARLVLPADARQGARGCIGADADARALQHDLADPDRPRTELERLKAARAEKARLRPARAFSRADAA